MGGHVRTVPIPTWVKTAMDAWTAAAEISHGPVFRAINKTGRRVGEMACRPRYCGMSSVRRRRAPASISLRLTTSGAHAPGCVTSRAENWTRFSFCQTRLDSDHERYLGCKQRLRSAVNDRLGLEPETD
jgi:hypothetical protein